MPKYVKLHKPVVKRIKVEMRRYDARIFLSPDAVWRKKHARRTPSGTMTHTSRVLPVGAFDAAAAPHKPVYFSP
jgi:hypothetical protein